MQNDWQNTLTTLLPSFFAVIVFFILIFILAGRTRKTKENDLDSLRQSDSEKWTKVIKANAYSKLLVWTFIALFPLGGSVYNFIKFPNGEKLFVIFGFCIGILFVWVGVSSYFKEMKKLGNKSK